MHTASSIDIAASPAAVWARLVRTTEYPELLSPSQEILAADHGVVRSGSFFRERAKIGPLRTVLDWTATEVDVNRWLVTEGTDGYVRIRLEWLLTETDDGTRLVQTMRLHPRWFMSPVVALLWPLMLRRRAQRAWDETLVRIRDRAVRSRAP